MAHRVGEVARATSERGELVVRRRDGDVVELRVNGVFVGSAPLVNGLASGTVQFKKGNYTLTATYVGDAAFNGSSGTVLHHTK